MTEQTIDDSKKPHLFEVFRAAVWRELVGNKELEEAHVAASAAGVTEKDMETVFGWDAAKIKGFFGEAAFNRDLINAMKASDNLTGVGMMGFSGSTPFKDMGFYK